MGAIEFFLLLSLMLGDDDEVLLPHVNAPFWGVNEEVAHHTHRCPARGWHTTRTDGQCSMSDV